MSGMIRPRRPPDVPRDRPGRLIPGRPTCDLQEFSAGEPRSRTPRRCPGTAATRPWTGLRRADPTQERAEAEMQGRHREFLARSPFMRSEDNTISLDDSAEHAQPHPHR
jgi:hypothetical protein